jgi:hypothetical protein
MPQRRARPWIIAASVVLVICCALPVGGGLLVGLRYYSKWHADDGSFTLTLPSGWSVHTTSAYQAPDDFGEARQYVFSAPGSNTPVATITHFVDINSVDSDHGDDCHNAVTFSPAVTLAGLSMHQLSDHTWAYFSDPVDFFHPGGLTLRNTEEFLLSDDGVSADVQQQTEAMFATFQPKNRQPSTCPPYL